MGVLLVKLAHVVSAVLLISGASCIFFGLWLALGLGWALVALGCLLIAADWLVGS